MGARVFVCGEAGVAHVATVMRAIDGAVTSSSAGPKVL